MLTFRGQSYKFFMKRQWLRDKKKEEIKGDWRVESWKWRVENYTIWPFDGVRERTTDNGQQTTEGWCDCTVMRLFFTEKRLLWWKLSFFGSFHGCISYAMKPLRATHSGTRITWWGRRVRTGMSMWSASVHDETGAVGWLPLLVGQTVKWSNGEICGCVFMWVNIRPRWSLKDVLIHSELRHLVPLLCH